MKTKFYLLFFLGITTGLYSHSQAPAQPANSVPVNQSITGNNDVNLCATVTDPNGDAMQVKYFGRTKTAAGSKKFTIVFLPDTQYYTAEPQGTNGGNIEMFNAQTKWIAENRGDKNIVYVGQLGDCVENADLYEVEWQRAQGAMAKIEDPDETGLLDGIPFGICVGNHEQSPFNDAAGTTNFYNQYFGIDHFNGRDYYGGHYGANNDNHYQLFTASGIPFLVISLEFDLNMTRFTAANGPLDWAEALVQNFPDRKVIVMTHYAIHEDSSFGGPGGPIYERLKHYSNFSFLMSAHVSSVEGGEARRTDVFNGNRVYSILSDYQFRPNGGNGLMRIYEFDPAQNKVSVQTYSPYAGVYETDESSQFELPFVMQPEVSVLSNVVSGTSPCHPWNDLDYSTSYEWCMQLYDGENITTGPLWSFTTASDPLPVSFVEFTATPESERVKLLWKTASEFNNDRFEVERSVDGTTYIKIGSVKGQGSSNNEQQYVFYDDKPLIGKTYYRLKQIDIDNHFTYSLVRTVNNDDKPLWKVYPNPANSNGIDIYFTGRWNGNVKVACHDMLGREVFQTSKTGIQNKIQVSRNFQPGIYIISIAGENGYSARQVVLVDD